MLPGLAENDDSNVCKKSRNHSKGISRNTLVKRVAKGVMDQTVFASLFQVLIRDDGR
jgi:hypothetical protein